MVFQAFASKEVRENIWMCYPFHEYGAHLWKSYENLEKQLEEIRQAGYSELPFVDRVRVGAAVPILDLSKNLTVVLGASKKATKRDEREKGQAQLLKLIMEEKAALELE